MKFRFWKKKDLPEGLMRGGWADFTFNPFKSGHLFGPAESQSVTAISLGIGPEAFDAKPITGENRRDRRAV